MRAAARARVLRDAAAGRVLTLLALRKFLLACDLVADSRRPAPRSIFLMANPTPLLVSCEDWCESVATFIRLRVSEIELCRPGRRLGVDGAFPGPRRLAAAAVIT